MAQLKDITLEQIRSTFREVKKSQVKFDSPQEMVKYLLSFIIANEEMTKVINERLRMGIHKDFHGFTDAVQASIVIHNLIEYSKGHPVNFLNEQSVPGRLLKEIIDYFESNFK